MQSRRIVTVHSLLNGRFRERVHIHGGHGNLSFSLTFPNTHGGDRKLQKHPCDVQSSDEVNDVNDCRPLSLFSSVGLWGGHHRSPGGFLGGFSPSVHPASCRKHTFTVTWWYLGESTASGNKTATKSPCRLSGKITSDPVNPHMNQPTWW